MTAPPDIILAAACGAAYLVGSIPTGLLLGKAYGIDVRQEGSGNIGATNLYRTLGRRVGVLTLIGDCLKGLAPVLAARYLAPSTDLAAWVGLAVFCGNVFSVFLKFKGGKGGATALGVFLALSPLAVAIALAVFLVLVLKWRYVSLGTVAAAAVMPFAVYVLRGSRAMLLVTALVAVIMIIRHYANIKRLVDGTENKFKA